MARPHEIADARQAGGQRVGHVPRWLRPGQVVQGSLGQASQDPPPVQLRQAFRGVDRVRADRPHVRALRYRKV